LSVHRQAGALEAIELIVIGPMPDKILIGYEDSRSFVVSSEFADWFARLNKQRLVVLQLAQAADNRFVSIPAPGRAAGPAVNDQPIRILRHSRIEIVHQHPHRGFLMPPFASEFISLIRVDDPFAAHNSS
jgi:hypothetical protein